MNSGRQYGLAIAAGITSGSLIWSVSAALGLGALMLTNLWAVELLRYFGACYLLYLAYKSARSALTISQSSTQHVSVSSKQAAYAKGLALHLTNPKAIFFFGSLFAIGVPPDSPPSSLAIVIAAVGLQSLIVFHGYALLFSSAPMVAGYAKLRRGFEAAFALAFGAAGMKILTARLD
jgi:threonine/homoserine/homoserine lactone efflux protein